MSLKTGSRNLFDISLGSRLSDHFAATEYFLNTPAAVAYLGVSPSLRYQKFAIGNINATF